MRDGHPTQDLTTGVFITGHLRLVNPVVTFLGAVSPLCQIGRERALSAMGLLVQAIVFALVAVSWLTRVPLNMNGETWYEWYTLKGWAFIDNAIFAAVQLVLFIAARQGSVGAEQETVDGPTDGEREPLLREETRPSGCCPVG
ncbi:hypothetical protein SPI_06220 [Niveomyces insectorum RCEF 264]|uniref:Uncharacterized protein n=1 Tax=Niveomyces insectorum RCEF 264 TaxID=1081102 RepID=A0A167RWT4_9HYPO|nr:hypothetical protein SPI_06220 [Niveomyces insectorum RCEF 264]